MANQKDSSGSVQDQSLCLKAMVIRFANQADFSNVIVKWAKHEGLGANLYPDTSLKTKPMIAPGQIDMTKDIQTAQMIRYILCRTHRMRRPHQVISTKAKTPKS